MEAVIAQETLQTRVARVTKGVPHVTCHVVGSVRRAPTRSGGSSARFARVTCASR